MTVHRATHYYGRHLQLIEKNVFIKGTRHEKKSPIAQPSMGKATVRTQLRVLSQQQARGFDCLEVTLRDFPACLRHVPGGLLFYVSDKVVRLQDVHDADRGVRACNRFRIPSKSAVVKGVRGLSDDSSNHASSSGVI
jgi:hypothetical protein